MFLVYDMKSVGGYLIRPFQDATRSVAVALFQVQTENNMSGCLVYVWEG